LHFSGIDYWYMWKLHMVGKKDTNAILAKAEKCNKANPDKSPTTDRV